MAYNDRLKEARSKSGLTQEQLAERLGIAKSTLSGYESGNREPSVATTAKFLDILKIDANFLYQDEMQDAYKDTATPHEFKHIIKKYRELDTHGKEMVDFTLEKEWERSCEQSKNNIQRFNQKIYLNAASKDATATDEERRNSDNIMYDDSEWE